MRSGIRKKLDDVYVWIENSYRAYARVKQVKRTLKLMDGGNKKNDLKYNNEYLDYWKSYGKKPSKIWLRLYSKDNEDFNPRYIPDDLWYREILPYFSNMEFRRPYEDKCFHDTLFSNVNRPKTIIKCVAGVYYDENNNIISKSLAINEIMSSKSAIIKPSIDSGQGRLIQFFDIHEDKIDSLEEKLSSVGQNFIVQEIVKQHIDMDSLNPNTLNTVRVITFLFKGEVHILSIIARMGSGSSKVDNVSAGGLQITVNPDGSFTKYASDKKRNKHIVHPDTKTVFEDFKVPSFDQIIKIAKENQKKLPHFKIVGWDFAIKQNGDPVFIEYNVCPGSNQMTGGPTFGDLTEDVLKEVYIDKNYKDAKN